MKKAVLLLVIFLTTASIFAQVKIRPGVKLGINNSRVQGINDSESLQGINAAAFVNFDFTRFYELQLETGYSQQGTSVRTYNSNFINGDNPTFGTQYQTEDLNLNYLTLGIANKFFVAAKDHGFHFIVGPSIDILVNDTRFESTPIDFSFFAGIGYEFSFGLAIEARYKQGIVNVEDDYYYDDYYYDNDNYYTNSVFQVSAAYKFDF